MPNFLLVKIAAKWTLSIALIGAQSPVYFPVGGECLPVPGPLLIHCNGVAETGGQSTLPGSVTQGTTPALSFKVNMGLLV
jgi:hypothetical protein